MSSTKRKRDNKRNIKEPCIPSNIEVEITDTITLDGHKREKKKDKKIRNKKFNELTKVFKQDNKTPNPGYDPPGGISGTFAGGSSSD